MISRNALYSFVESLIENAGIDEPLRDAVTFRNLRTSVDEAEKVIRIECFTGQHCMTTEDVRKELKVQFTIQCWVTPDNNRYSDEQIANDAAVDLSFDMSRVIFEAIAANTSLGGLVCDAECDEFESGEANLGATQRGVTFLDGVINQAS